MRVPLGLAAFGGRPGCELEIIGPGRQCPDTALGAYTHASWRGWVVGSSMSGDEHLVLTASPRPEASYAKLVNGPAWYPKARVRVLGSVSVNGQRMREVYVPSATNEGSAFARHVVLIWTIGGHTYGAGFHDVNGMQRTLALDLELARSIKLVWPH